MGPIGPAGPAGPAGPQGAPGSANISIASGTASGTVQITAPGFSDTVYDTTYITQAITNLNQSIVAAGSPTLANIVGAVPACVAEAVSSSQTICANGSILVVGGIDYAPMPMVNGLPVQTTAFAGLKLGATASAWNTITTFNDTANTVLEITGSVQGATGTYASVNASTALQVRVLNGNVQEWHTSPTLASSTVFVQIRYTANSAAKLARAATASLNH